ncbi:MAG: hypothetical protein FJ014_02840 [Chloroflexi bacterium]|nr:hypothetical protein [Chloroflexota bacterium]
MKRLTVLALILILLLPACSQPTPEVIEETVVVYVTPQPLPTYTPYPTYTPVPPAPTYTPYPTPTPRPEAPTSTPTPQPPTPTNTPLPTPSAYLGVTRQGGKLGAIWNLADVRYHLHPDRLRVVWEMAEPGDHVPFFEAVQVDNAAEPFPLGHDLSWGVARIDLVMSDVYAYDFPLGRRLPITPPDNPLVTRIGLYPTFSDAHLGFSIGLKKPSLYEVYELTDPVRIVIDVLQGD